MAEQSEFDDQRGSSVAVREKIGSNTVNRGILDSEKP